MNILNRTVLFLLLSIYLCNTTSNAKKQKSAVLTGISDHKEFKKLLRSKNNILVLFILDQTASKSITDIFKETADIVRGHATVAIVDCSTKEGKKLCKTLKIDEEKPYCIKHYKDGRHHKDYDRNKSVTSMVNFLRDPTGELPWEEDPTATNIVHLQDGDALTKLLKRGPAAFKNAMIMFYAPWCGYCKTLKPEYVMAAADLKGEAILAAIDVAKPGNSRIRQQYNITGFPTLLFYERGHFRFPYTGENKRKALVEFMRDPITQFDVKPKPPAEESWSNDSHVVHLNSENFDTVLQNVDALVVFYAPWCGHCKKIKPEYEKAAEVLKKSGAKGILAAVDATQEPQLAARYSVSGYPTIKYFSKGEFKFDAGHVREEKKLVEFMKNPQEPPPPPPPETPWSEEESSVKHLNADTFRTALRKVKHALVMFYAPWCGHCKRAKPEIMKAAEVFDLELRVLFAAVDCTIEHALCTKYNITGYPTIKYFSHFDRVISDYEGGRTQKDFINFIHTQLGDLQESNLPKGEETKGDSQAAGFGRNVIILNDDTYEAAIAQDTPTFVMYYATWCGHCSSTKPAFSALATKLNSEGTARAVAVDVGTYQKVADLAGIDSMPTFKLYASGKLIADYDGDRSTDDMFHFITSNTKLLKTEL